MRSAIPMARALRLCPQLVVVPPDFTRYAPPGHSGPLQADFFVPDAVFARTTTALKRF